MGQTIGERDRTTWSTWLSEFVIPGVAIDLQHTAKPAEMMPEMTSATILGVEIDCGRLRRTLPRPVINRVAPKPSNPGSSSCAIQHRQRRIIAKYFPCRHHPLDQQRVQRLQPPCCALNPMYQGRAVEIEALSRQHLHLPVQRQMPGKF